MRRGTSGGTFGVHPLLRPESPLVGRQQRLATEGTVARAHRSVRVDEQLLNELERLARERRVPVTFAEQVDAGLRLLVQRAADEQSRWASLLVAADHDRADLVYRRLRRQP